MIEVVKEIHAKGKQLDQIGELMKMRRKLFESDRKYKARLKRVMEFAYLIAKNEMKKFKYRNI